MKYQHDLFILKRSTVRPATLLEKNGMAAGGKATLRAKGPDTVTVEMPCILGRLS